MLPAQEPEKRTKKNNTALYADTGAQMLLKKLDLLGANRNRLKAKIIGGGNLFAWASSEKMKGLGRSNIDMVRKELIANQIYIAAEEVGGNMYKSIRCHSTDGKVVIRTDKDLEKYI
jgi:chemotaxis protein CheD